MRSNIRMLLLLAAIVVVGCSTGDDPAGEHGHEGDGHEGHSHESEKPAEQVSEHSLEGWWCSAHGVPEEECTRCDLNLVAGFKEDGDWCDDHDRPDSQCFQCYPELEKKFAARFEAKFGRAPPKATQP